MAGGNEEVEFLKCEVAEASKASMHLEIYRSLERVYGSPTAPIVGVAGRGDTAHNPRDVC
ncbi:MAG: hypothetical protein QW330_02320 [Nitrososphaerota archaeon]